MERESPPKGMDSSVPTFLFSFPVSQTLIGSEPVIWEPGCGLSLLLSILASFCGASPQL